MRKRVLKPGDTHLMSPDEEYCRLVYERQSNDACNLSIEVYDVDGVTHTSKYQRLSAEAVVDHVQSILGEGWETIFAQEYDDWAIYCKKRPRERSQQRSIIRTKSPMSRNAILGAVAVCAALLVFGWIAGRVATYRNQPALAPNENSGAVEPEEEVDEGADAAIDPAGESNDLPTSDSVAAESTDTEVASESDPVESDGTNEATAVTLDAETGEATETVPAIALQSDNDPFEQAVRIAQETVLEGRVANTQEEWEALAERWQQAADLMGDVPSEDERYDVAQDRIERYENNREAALSEAEKF